jgi:hypothetical protein
VNEPTKVELTLRDALHDAADHAPLASPTPLADAPTRVSAARNRPRALVAACVIALGVALTIGAVVTTRDDGNGLRVASPGESSGEVPVTEIPRTSANLEVFMAVKATDDEIAAVRAQIDASPDVVRYAYVNRDAQYLEFAEIFACNQDLVHSIRAEDLPASFRIQTTGPDATANLRTSLDASPGVESIEAPGDATSTTSSCSDTLRAEPDQPDQSELPATTIPSIPPKLPEPGDQPTDPTTSHDAVVAAFVQAWDGTSSVEQRRAAMQASDQLAAELDRARSGNEATIATMKAVVGDVTFVAPDRAAVVFHLEFQSMTYPDQLGYAVLDGGVWKVSRETVCDVLRMAATVSCPAS